jgi:micrococcal nuclease
MLRRSPQGWVPSSGVDLFAAALLLIVLAFLVRAFEPPSISRARESSRVQVDRVHDGDSLWLEHQGEVHYFRLLGVDAPEVQHSARLREQAERLNMDPELLRSHGESAKRWLLDRLRSQDHLVVQFDRRQKDKYGRYLAHVFLPGQHRSLNEELLRAGLAIRYRDRMNRLFQKEYDLAYREARESKRGIWARATPSHRGTTRTGKVRGQR